MRIVALLGACVLLLSGCTVRTYKLTRDRVDQDLTAGNRGYLAGEPSEKTEADRKTTRTTHVVEVEFQPLVRFEKSGKEKGPAPVLPSMPAAVGSEDWGNRGYVSGTPVLKTEAQPRSGGAFEEYTVQKGDTLQKISKKFYGTTKRWNKIYEANQDSLKAPDKIYPGQVIRIPAEGIRKLAEPAENLK